MKISQRKERLRARGVVPVAQETAIVSAKAAAAPARGRSKTATGRRGTAVAKSTRTRWQPGPRYQLIFGVTYMLFSPILGYENFAISQRPHSKTHPGAFELILPVVFFFFGVWWFYRGWQAWRRQRAAGVAGSGATGKTELLKGSSQ